MALLPGLAPCTAAIAVAATVAVTGGPTSVLPNTVDASASATAVDTSPILTRGAEPIAATVAIAAVTTATFVTTNLASRSTLRASSTARAADAGAASFLPQRWHRLLHDR